MNLKHVTSWLVGSALLYGAVAACTSSPSGETAHAQETGGSSANGGSSGCGTCSVPQNLRVVTADSDVNQHLGGGVDVNPGGAIWLDEGPFYLTDARISGDRLLVAVADSSADCGNGELLLSLSSGDPGGYLAGGRLLVPAGKKLCVRNDDPTDSSRLTWGGFRPY